MIYIRNLFLFLIVLNVQLSIQAQVKLPALVSDNMVLQQNAKVNLWGWASPNEKINIQLGWQNTPVEIVANSDGNWKVAVDTPKGSETPYSIQINATNKIVLNKKHISETKVITPG
ncbi:MAG: 9-O-acetylesterase, partial [Flavobacterium sp.]